MIVRIRLRLYSKRTKLQHANGVKKSLVLIGLCHSVQDYHAVNRRWHFSMQTACVSEKSLCSRGVIRDLVHLPNTSSLHNIFHRMLHKTLCDSQHHFCSTRCVHPAVPCVTQECLCNTGLPVETSYINTGQHISDVRKAVVIGS